MRLPFFIAALAAATQSAAAINAPMGVLPVPRAVPPSPPAQVVAEDKTVQPGPVIQMPVATPQMIQPDPVQRPVAQDPPPLAPLPPPPLPQRPASPPSPYPSSIIAPYPTPTRDSEPRLTKPYPPAQYPILSKPGGEAEFDAPVKSSAPAGRQSVPLKSTERPFIERFRPRYSLMPTRPGQVVVPPAEALAGETRAAPDGVAITAPAMTETRIPVSDDGYETLPDSFEGTALEARMDSDGVPLMRTAVLTGSYKQNVARFLNNHGYKAVWSNAPECLDWRVESNYAVQGRDFTAVLERLTDGYPVRSTIHEPSRVVRLNVTQLYRLDCQ